LGRAFNEALCLIPDGHWAVLCELDTFFLTPDAGTILEGYAERYGEAGLFTCITNRVHHLAVEQLFAGRVSENTDIRHHIEIAENQKRFLYNVTPINHCISGYLMMVKKEVWKKITFMEGIGCLGVDNYFSQAVLQSGKKILRMDAMYLWHSYRLKNGVTDKTHLR
jgi:GT2 family glycosyltransferase